MLSTSRWGEIGVSNVQALGFMSDGDLGCPGCNWDSGTIYGGLKVDKSLQGAQGFS